MKSCARWRCKSCGAMVIASSVEDELPEESAQRAIAEHRRGCAGALERLTGPEESTPAPLAELVDLAKIRERRIRK